MAAAVGQRPEHLFSTRSSSASVPEACICSGTRSIPGPQSPKSSSDARLWDQGQAERRAETPPAPPQSGLAGLLSKASPVRYTAETSTHLSDVGLTLPCGSPEKWEPQGGADVSNEQGKVRGMNNRKGAEEGNPEGAWVVDQMTPMSLKCACIFLKFGPNIG